MNENELCECGHTYSAHHEEYWEDDEVPCEFPACDCEDFRGTGKISHQEQA